MSNNQLYKNILEETYLATAQGRIEDFKSHLAADISWTEAAGFPYAGTYIGPDAVIENVHARLGSEWTNYSATPVDYAFSGNRVMVYGYYKGTYNLTQKSFQADFVHIYDFNAENKITHFIQIVDSALVEKAMR
ncbi:nuclear transport factor 2 family protein [Streptococcus suis]|nr:nuclear transport factor 2 family protein [Streptococcus suis]HEM5074086.1 nuclear transport factor 2 family protein [Streptococcus suis]HEM5091783.1 nuclear transport factor 2 family protein [Streptococcus suis]HEM5172795.1 nuclear transport factor 2 family protein [Streptococcus suis]HEM5254147.1 nuclear transport factor 2 family protein [Streptococcus suis]